MKNAGKTLIYAASCVAVVVAARAASFNPPPSKEAPPEPKVDPASLLSKDNPYGPIVERNVFDLHDPPPPPPPKEEKAPPSNIKLTGITTIFGTKQALFLVTDASPGKAAITHSSILREHQRYGVLEVLEINPKERTAKIKNEDIESVISIETNKVAAAGGPPPPGMGGMPGSRGGPYTPPGAPPNFQRGGFNPGGGTVLPSRPMRSENQQNNTPAQTYANGYNGGYGGAPSIQTPGGALNLNGNTTLAGGSTGSPQSAQTSQPALTAEESYTLIEAQRMKAQQTGDPVALIFPPTPLSMGLNQQSEATQNEQNSPAAPPTPPTPGQRGSGTLSGGVR